MLEGWARSTAHAIHGLAATLAIKILSPAVSSDPSALQRFQQEARAAATLNHPNIIAVHDIGAHEGSPYIVSEMRHGQTLRDELSNGALSPWARSDPKLDGMKDYPGFDELMRRMDSRAERA